MTWEHDQLWCDCGGATTELDDDSFECLQCGARHRWNERKEEWEEVK